METCQDSNDSGADDGPAIADCCSSPASVASRLQSVSVRTELMRDILETFLAMRDHWSEWLVFGIPLSFGLMTLEQASSLWSDSISRDDNSLSPSEMELF